MKNLVISKARPAPPINGPHQSATSALPDRAWHMTKTLSPFRDSFPRVLYATGTLRRVVSDSRVKDGTMAMCWFGIRAANGFSGWPEALSTGFSVRSVQRESRCLILTESLGQGNISGPFFFFCIHLQKIINRCKYHAGMEVHFAWRLG